MSKFSERLAVTPETRKKARLLALLLDIAINEAVDLALTKMLEEVQAKEKEQAKKKK